MKLKPTVISQFIQTNVVAYDKAAVIFHDMETTGETWATGLAAAGGLWGLVGRGGLVEFWLAEEPGQKKLKPQKI